VKIARATFTLASAALLTLGGSSLHAFNHAGEAKDDATKAPVPDPLAAARTAAGGDAVLDALLTELDRSKAKLKMDQVAAPYYIEYRVNDVEEYQAEAAFGAVRESQRVRYRVLRVVVRIGDYKQDSYYNQGMGETNILPLDDDPIALRHQIWLATDEAYKAAGEAFTEKQAALKQFSADLSPVDDFAKAPVVADVEPTVTLHVDDAKWKKTLEDVTNLYRQYPDVQSVSASARFSAINEYLVNSEGTVTRSGKKTYNVGFNSSAQAADGMRLSRNPFWMFADAKELPTHDALLADGLARKAHGEVGVDKGPLPEIQHGRSAVAEIGGDHRAHRLRDRKTLDQRPVGAIPDRTGPGHAKTAARGAERKAGHERAGGEICGIDARLIGAGKFEAWPGDISRQLVRLRLDLQHGGADRERAASV